MAGRAHNRRTSIGEQFSPRVVRMLESPAYRVLSQSEHRCLSRLEVELGHHGGTDNGRLPCTYDHFEEYGVHRKSIGPSLRALAALGFIEITEQGRAGNAEYRRPNMFRLTFRHTAGREPTHEWQRIKTVDEAEFIAKRARDASPRKHKSSGGTRTKHQCGIRTRSRPIRSAKSATTCVSTESGTTSISRVGGGSGASTKADGIRTFAVLHNGGVRRVGAFLARRERQAQHGADLRTMEHR